VSLKAALERVATATGLRLSYSAELLPLDRDVCLSYDANALGDVLADLLEGVAVEPVVAGHDHVVLAPKTARAAADIQDPQPLFPLAPIFATASAEPPYQQVPSYGFTRMDHEQIGRYGSVAQALSAGVPGVWAWQSPSGFTTHYSVRGAGSFGAGSPKIYIDGIEVANPLLATQILPENIERIEFIRGPQGAALYGADAINGVTNIVTRHEVVADGLPRLRVRSGLELSRSDYTAGSEVGQEHTVALSIGSRLRSGAINVGLGSAGEYLPGSYSRHINLDGSMRLLTDRTLVTTTARFATQSAGNPFGLIADSALHSSSLSMQQYTVGAKAVIQQNDRITHSIVLGADGYTLGDWSTGPGLMFSRADSVLRAAGDGALRTTARVSTAARVIARANATTAITVAAEHSNLHQYGELSDALSYQSPSAKYAAGHSVQGELGTRFEQSRSSNGLIAQLDASVFERAFLTAGLRVERDEINGVMVGTSTLPMISGAYVIGDGAVNARFRGSYGKAVRWPDMQRRALLGPNTQNSTVLAPEQQSGLEAGLDLNIGKTFELQITRFDQTASGLMQCVTLLGSYTPGGEADQRPAYAVQSVGEIDNRGWELQGSVQRGALTLSGTLSFVESRVLRIADGYAGDLRAGDRMLGVPARTASIDASWLGSGWSTSLMAYRAFNWINYDRRGLAATQPGEVIGGQLRDYWQQYNGSTHLRATFARNLTRRFTLLLSGDNLLDKQTGEPDNLTVVPGRTVSFGVKAAF
jgi:iron complex outermembrane receptor protein